MELVDICFNFAHKSFRKDEAEVVRRAVDAGVTLMLVTGSSLEDSAHSIELADKYPQHLYATAGIHPHYAKDWTEHTQGALAEMAGHEKVKALGEMGLDFNRNFSPPAAQERAFEAQLELAVELQMPVFLHERDAHSRFIEILGRYRDRLPAAVVHCFTGTGDELDAYLAMDLHIGITGWICDERRGAHLNTLVGRIPMDRLMIETDAPYLLPHDLQPRPKSRRNEPAYLGYILARLAQAMGKPASEVAAGTTWTAKRFYALIEP